MNSLIIGIDPSVTATGLFETASGRAQTIKTKAARGDARLHDISNALLNFLARCERYITLAVLEDLPISARAAGKTGMAHGVIRERLISMHIDYITLPPATLKKAAVGSGKADKADMIEGYRAAYPDVTVTDDNQADAAWLAECGRAFLGMPHNLAAPEALDKYVDRLPDSIKNLRLEVAA